MASEPLYLVVRRRITAAIAEGSIASGAAIPSEMELARQLGVHQGTVRKAIDGLVADRVLVRRQGSGTYVAVPDDEAILFRFFRLRGDTPGEARFPNSRVLSRTTAAPTDTERSRLALSATDRVHRVTRVRHVGDAPLLAETLAVPLSRFAGIDAIDPLPNNVYRLFADHFGRTVARADEEIKAVAAEEFEAETLGVAIGTPLLEITRVAFDIGDHAIELRVSRCRTDDVHYRNVLR